MKRKIFLHGYLADLVPGPIELDADCVAEAIKGLCKVTGRAFTPDPKRGRHAVKVVGFDDLGSLFAETDVTELHVVPAMCGGKNAGIFQVVIGVIMIAAAVWTGGASLAAYVSAQGLTLAGSAVLMGAMMVVGGMLAMMSAAPQIDTTAAGQDPEASKYLPATQNTVKIGTRISILVGRFPMGGQFLSFNVDAKNVAV